MLVSVLNKTLGYENIIQNKLQRLTKKANKKSCTSQI